MPWLVRDGKVLATLEVATSLRDRTRGLLGRDGIDGAILLRPAKSVHTFRMRFPIDVAFCDRELRVLKVVTLARNRVTRPMLTAHAIIESEAGVMGKWGIGVGDQLDIRGLDAPDGDDADDDGHRRPAPPGRAAARPGPANGHRPDPAPPTAGDDPVIDVRGDGGARARVVPSQATNVPPPRTHSRPRPVEAGGDAGRVDGGG